jgi:hypothetical protein
MSLAARSKLSPYETVAPLDTALRLPVPNPANFRIADNTSRIVESITRG